MVSAEDVLKGLLNPYKATKHVVRNAVVAGTSRYPVGTHVLSRDWDLLVILDTCRVDALQTVAGEFGFIDDVDQIWSLGGSSPEWIAHTFDRRWSKDLNQTAYLNVNAWAERILDGGLHASNRRFDNVGVNRLSRYGTWDVIQSEELGYLEHVWKYVDSDGGEWATAIPDEYIHGRAPPRHLTDRAIRIGRQQDFDRYLLHYSQPHAPYVSSAISDGRELFDYEQEPFEYLRRGGDLSTVYETYLDELRYVLSDVALLLENFDAEKVVITADHGEAFGEYGVYGHHAGSIHPHIRRVPWALTSARDSGTYSPEIDPDSATDRSVEDALEALGYKI